MITEELEKKLKISRYTCIHCPTLELAIQVVSIFHQLGLKWSDETHYTLNHNWDSFKENTTYYPFDGEVFALGFAHLTERKVIRAEEFIALHTEDKEFDLENYEPKGDLEGFPKEIIARMLDCQEKQGNPRDVSVFEKHKSSTKAEGGFDWDKTKEAELFWFKVITEKNFNLFFEKYPKKEDNSQEFNLENYTPKGDLIGFPKEIIARMLDCQEEQGTKRDVNVFEKYKSCSLWEGGFDWEETKEKDIFWYDVILIKNFDLFFKRYPKKEDNQEFIVGDKVIDIISGQIGKVTKIDTLNNDSYSILVDFNNNEVVRFTLDGRYYGIDKYPRLLHYRDDYNYDVIDFNNLPKREPNRWRANKGSCYWVIENFSVYEFKENNTDIDDTYNNLGNYFKTKEEAQEVADKLKKYFQELIKSK